MILASQSEARRRLLLRLGFTFETIPAHIDEAAVQEVETDPRLLVKTLARAKAQHVFIHSGLPPLLQSNSKLASHSMSKSPRKSALNLNLDSMNRMVIGSDQVLVLENRGKSVLLGKPHTSRQACRQLELCSGKAVTLLTGVHIEASPTRELAAFRRSWVHMVKMEFRKLSNREIRDYVALDRPLECAGSFKFEEHGISLFARVSTTDPTSIEGLPLLGLHNAILASRRRF